MQLTDGNQVWASVADVLRTQLTEAVWMSTFSNVAPIRIGDRELTVSVPNNHVRDRILTRFLPLVSDALEETTGGPCQLVILVDPTAPYLDLDQRPDGSVDGRPTESLDGPRTDAAAAARATRRRRRPAQLAVHVRDVRQGSVQPVRPRRRPARRRDARADVQPTVHLRLGRARQDPPVARHRPLHPSQLSALRRALRHQRDVPQRVRRRHPLQDEHRLPTPLPRGRCPAHRRHPVPRGARRPAGRVLPHVQRPARRQQADRDLLGPRARPHPDAAGAADRADEVGARSPTSSHPTSRPAWRSCATRPTAITSRCHPRRWSSSPARSRRTSVSSRAR